MTYEKKNDDRKPRRQGPKLWLIPDEYGDIPEPNEETREKLKSKAYNYCIWALSQGDRTKKFLVDRMTVKHCPEDIIEETIARIEELGWLSDERYAESFVRDRQDIRKTGKRKIQMELRQKGVPSDIIDNALADVDEDEEKERAASLISRRIHSTRNVEPRKRVDRLASYLVRNGYGPGIAFAVVKEALAAENVELDDADEA